MRHVQLLKVRYNDQERSQELYKTIQLLYPHPIEMLRVRDDLFDRQLIFPSLCATTFIVVVYLTFELDATDEIECSCSSLMICRKTSNAVCGWNAGQMCFTLVSVPSQAQIQDTLINSRKIIDVLSHWFPIDRHVRK
jgi:hypothetical protein